MSRTNRRNHRATADRERRVSVRGIRRDTPDFRKLGRTLLELARADAEARAQAQAQAQREPDAARDRGEEADDAA
ncbi:hypothetical protein [Curtobacterium sp. GD1]|uniref:hypothetical protein n=1 Tax=Curtobacterium sp. GD1 TaxID=2810612 RepID=UPI001E4EF623|nr:hypothetical protein [Curtobacterium sp. GD1]MCC8907749.1 hypothetical protein [Curtobacterium sp. GD1]